MILQVLPTVCLSYLSLGGIFALGGVLGYVICNVLDKDPTGDVDDKLISNGQALEMIRRYHEGVDENTRSGHIEIGVLHGYINRIEKQCKDVGTKLAGLEYYFAKYGPNPDTGSTALDPNTDDNRSTIVIYPTFKAANGDFVPFDPSVSATGDIKTVEILNDENNWGQRNGSLDHLYNAGRNVLDRLHMSPPRQPTL